MKKLKKYLKSISYTISIILITIFILTILNYLNIINYKILSILGTITIIISTFIGGTIIGKNTEKKGWIAGISLSLILTTILIIFNLVIIKKLDLTNLIYYSIIIISTTLGSMIGINKKL